jgi:hypothetical protein
MLPTKLGSLLPQARYAPITKSAAHHSSIAEHHNDSWSYQAANKTVLSTASTVAKCTDFPLPPLITSALITNPTARSSTPPTTRVSHCINNIALSTAPTTFHPVIGAKQATMGKSTVSTTCKHSKHTFHQHNRSNHHINLFRTTAGKWFHTRYLGRLIASPQQFEGTIVGWSIKGNEANQAMIGTSTPSGITILTPFIKHPSRLDRAGMRSQPFRAIGKVSRAISG